MSAAVAARICPFCRSATPADAVVCWLCQSRMPPVAQRPASQPATAPAPGTLVASGSREAPSKVEPDFVLWSVGTVLSCLVMTMVVLDFALLGGFGGAALAAVASAPVVVALGSMVWLRRPGRPAGGPLESSVRGVLGGVSIAVTVMLSVVFVICLMATALIVLLFILCSGSMH